MAPCTLTLICVYTELMGQIRESCTVIAAASAVTLWLTQRSSLALSLKGRPFAFQSQCGKQFSHLIGQINEGAVTSSITSLTRHSAFHYLCSSNWMILATALKYVNFSSMNISIFSWLPYNGQRDMCMPTAISKATFQKDKSLYLVTFLNHNVNYFLFVFM